MNRLKKTTASSNYHRRNRPFRPKQTTASSSAASVASDSPGKITTEATWKSTKTSGRARSSATFVSSSWADSATCGTTSGTATKRCRNGCKTARSVGACFPARTATTVI
uniref:(northern house mosquito) hypothetical protein n=1 Tax=Culex pipiens TaxID=7175 RepID=A0A8D8AG51_CULPI